MSLLVYRLSILLFRVAVLFAAPFNAKAKLALHGRKGLLKQIKKQLHDDNASKVWFHCASLGEFEQGRPIIERFKREFPEFKILITFFSPSGYEIRKDYELADFVFYLPWDTKKNAAEFIRLLRPDIAIFVKYEFWYHYLKTLKKNNIPILSVSSIFRANQIYFKPIGKFNLNILRLITHFFVQNRASEILLKEYNINNVEIAGDTRFDRVAEIVTHARELPAVEKFKGSTKVMVIGSCWPEDLEVLMSFINESPLKFIVAPHEINGKSQKIIEKDCMKKTILYSKLSNVKGDEDVLIIDNIGLLSSLYGYGEYAYVGGAFGAGLHNILEAATYGIPIFFGNKNYKKFNEATDLIKLGGAVAINDETELREQFKTFEDDMALQIAGQVNRDYVKDNTGATDKIINYCKKILQ